MRIIRRIAGGGSITRKMGGTCAMATRWKATSNCSSLWDRRLPSILSLRMAARRDFHPVPRLLEKPRARAGRADGQALFAALGARPHQVLVGRHAPTVVARGGIQIDPVPARRAGHLHWKIDVRYRP